MTNVIHLEDQPSLFDESLNLATPIEEKVEPINAVQSYLDAKDEGLPMTDLLERAVRLKAALTEMGRISSIKFGLVTAVDTDSGAEIWGRYRDGTRAVERNATKKAETTRSKTVKIFFARAMGYRMLRDTMEPLENRSELDKRSRHNYLVFESTFTGPVHAGLRDDFRKNLSRQITQQKRLRRKNNLAIPETIDNIKI